MSRQIEEQVVSMQFDNRNFERNVSTTMSTLDKLKQKLNMPGVSKGLENVGNTARNINLTPLANSVQAVSARFSALQVMGVTALANITNSAVNAGKRIAKSLTIDPIKTGFQEYETQINAVQTILANTSSKGTTLDQVNDALDELNLYADKTIYNFTEMTRNIGTFTAAGVDLETSVNAIQGIANLAAVSGSTSQQASTAMYQLSQALAAGTIRLMDWNSVVNAGMGGEVFQNALKETSRLLGTGADEAIEAAGSFRESLRYEWLTAEVLTETLKKFTTSGASEYISEYTGLSMDAVKAEMKVIDSAKDEASAIDKAAESLAKKSGKNKDEIKSALEMAYTAQNAATKVKTFSQLMDTLKESIQSGWSQTWKLIFGDFEEAKSLWTGISDFLTGDDGIITKFSNARNKLLEGALDNPFKGLVDKIDTAKKASTKLVDNVEKYEQIVDKVIQGDFGNAEERWEKLTELGYDWAYVQNKVNEKLGSSVRHATKYNEAQGESNKTVSKGIAELIKMDDAQLKHLGLTDKEIKALRDLEKQSEKTGIPIESLIKDIDQLSGRMLLINGFKNIGMAIVDVFKAIGQAYRDVFPAMKPEQLYDMIAAFHKFTTKLKMNDETAQKLRSTFRGLFAILDIIRTLAGGALRIAFKVINVVLDAFGLTVLDVTANIGDLLWAFSKWLKSDNVLVRGIQNGARAIAEFVKKVIEWIKAFKELPYVQKIINTFLESIKEVGKAGSHVIEGFKNGLKEGLTSIPELLRSIGKLLIKTICSVLGIQSPSTVMYAIGGFVIAGLIAGIIAGATGLWPEIGKLGEGIAAKFEEIKDKVVATVTSEDFKSVIERAFAGIVSILILTTIKKFANGLESLAGAFANIGESVAELLGSTAYSMKQFGKVLKSIAFNNRAEGFKKIAIALGILLGAVIGIAIVIKKFDLKAGDIWHVIGIVAALGVLLLGLSWVMDKLSSASMEFSKKADGVGFSLKSVAPKLIAIGIAILLVAAAVKLLGMIPEEELKQGFIGLAGALIGIIAVLGMFALIAKMPGAQYTKQVGKSIRSITISLLLLVGLIKLVGMLTPEDMANGQKFLQNFLTFYLIFMGISLLPVKDTGSSFLKLTIALGIMVGVCKLISKLTVENWDKVNYFLGGFAAFVLAMALISRVADNHKGKMSELGNFLLKLSGVMTIMVLVSYLVGLMSWDTIGKAGAFVGGFAMFILALAGISRIVDPSGMANMGKTLLLMSVAIGILAGIAIILGSIDPAILKQGIHFVGMLAIMLAGLIAVTYLAKDCTGTIVAITVCIAILAGAIAGLSFIDSERIWPAVGAMGALMGMFALLIFVTKYAQNSLKNIVALTVAVAVIGIVLYSLAQLPTEQALGAAGAVAIVIAALVAAIAILSKVKMDDPSTIGCVVALGLVVGILSGVLYLIAQIPTESALGAAAGLAIIMLSLTAAILILSKVKIDATMIGSVLAMGIVVAGISAALFLLAQIPSEQALKSAGILALVLLALTASLFLVSKIGPMSVISLIALAAALLILSVPIMLLGQMDLASVGTSLIALAGALAILLIAAAVASIGPVSIGLIVLAGACLALGAAAALVGIGLLAAAFAFKIISEIDPNALVEGVKALAESFLILADAALSVIPLIIEKIGEGLLKILEILIQAIPKLKDVAVAYIKAIADGIAESAINVTNAILDMVVGILQAIAEHVPDMVEAGTDIIVGFLEGIADAQADIIQAGFDLAISLINGLADGIRNNKDDVKEAIDNLCDALIEAFKSFFGIHSPSKVFDGLGGDLIQGLINGIKGKAGSVVGTVISLAGKLVKSVGSKASQWITKGKEFISKLGNGISSKASSVKSKAKEAASKAVEGLKSKLESFKSAGKSLVEGFKSGLSSKLNSIKEAAKKVGTTASDTVKKWLGINSPSKVFMEIGRFVDMGFAKGLEKYSSFVEDATSDVGRATMNSMSDVVSRVQDFINADMESQPTIRPVLDLTDIRSGANSINGLFGMTPSVGLLTNVGAVNAMMNNRQNGNDDVVSAIGKLRKDFEKLPRGDSYSVNGVSVTSDTEVENAIRTIVRKTRMERRT